MIDICKIISPLEFEIAEQLIVAGVKAFRLVSSVLRQKKSDHEGMNHEKINIVFPPVIHTDDFKLFELISLINISNSIKFV